MSDRKAKQCFVVGPIGSSGSPIRDHSDWLLEGIILPTMREGFAEYEVVRADRISEPGMIDSQIIGMLLDAELVIADMTDLNANAFYEMGIRHMAQKPIIHMFLEGTVIPFDVKPYRAVSFRLKHPNDLTNAKSSLAKAVTEASSNRHQVENPVTRARGAQKIKEHATPDQRYMLDEIRSLKETVSSLVASRLAQTRGNLRMKSKPQQTALIRFDSLSGEDFQALENLAFQFGGEVFLMSNTTSISVTFEQGMQADRKDLFESQVRSIFSVSALDWM